MTTRFRTFATLGLGLSLALVATQCRSPQWMADGPLGDTPTRSRKPDPGPLFTRTAFRASANDAGTRTVDATARGADGAAHLATAPLDLGGCHVYALRAATPAHSVAVYDGAQLWVRSIAPLPDALEITVHCRNDRYRPEGGLVWRVTLENIQAAPPTAAAPAFHAAAARFLEIREQHGYTRSRYDHFATGRLRALDAPARNDRRSRTDLAELMGLFTGFTSVEEALQTDRGLVSPDEPPGAADVDLAEVAGVGLAEHPWPKMIAEVGGKTSVEPMASAVPYDVAYLHFGDLRTFVKAARDVDTWGASAALALETSGGVKHFTDRYETELAVERTGLAERLGHLAADGVAVLIGDPYVREGTDVTLMFRVRNRTLLTGALDGFVATAEARHPGMKVETIEIGGVTVTHHSSSDGAVNRYQVELGDVLALSNSRAAVDRLIRTHKGEHPRLSDSGDFRYMRTLYPYGDGEDGFVFLGDALVARAVGPAQKIGESRRVRASADLLAVNHAALLYGWLEGRPPKSEEELLDSGILRATDLVHHDGERIVYDPERGAGSSWGTPARLVPLSDREFNTVTAREVVAYERFRNGYQNNWSTYIDPIAARIRRSDDGDYSVEARMLPLIDGSDYNELRRYVGDRRMPAPPVGYAAHIAVALADDARLRQMADQFAIQTTGSGKFGISWLGDWVMAGVGDRSGIWDVALATDVVDAGAEQPDSDRNMEAAVARAPLFVAAHVRNNLGLAAMLTALRAYSEQAAPGLIAWTPGEPYRDVPISEVRETMALRSARDPVVLSYCTVGDVFVLSLDRATLEEQIDAILDRTNAGPTDHQAVLALRPDPDKSWLTQTLLGLLEEPAYENHLRSARGWEVLAQGRGKLPADPAARRELAMTWLGHDVVGVHGQTYALDSDGLVTTGIYGSIPSPATPALPVPGSPLTAMMDDLRGLQFSVSFEGEGDHLSLRVRGDWARK